MKYMCCRCKDIFSANNDEVIWTYNMPICVACNDKGLAKKYSWDNETKDESSK